MLSTFDLHNNSTVATAFDLQTISTDTTTNGNTIDTKDYNMVEFVLTSGTLTDGAYTVTMQHGDDAGLSDVATVPAAEVLGSIDFALAEDDEAKRIGYIGKKRYVRINVVSTSTSSGGLFAGVVVKAAGMHNPQANQ